MENLKRPIPFIQGIMEINQYELAHWQNNLLVCGIDEVGRGPLAGPVVAAAVILKSYSESNLIKDSKVLSERQRLIAYDWIVKNGIFGIGSVNNRCIDRHNIRNATILAMKRALCNVMTLSDKKHLGAVIVDAMPLDLANCGLAGVPVFSPCRAESLSISVAAASIVAKIYRDTLMKRYSVMIPGYSFDQHKGYGTVLHQNFLLEKGSSIIHRASFLKNFIASTKELCESDKSVQSRDH
jgi:ribonuclease HII